MLHTDRLAKLAFRSPERIGMFVATILLLIGMAAWSISARMPILHDSIQLQSEMNMLKFDLDELRSLWSEDELHELEQPLSKAQSRIFDDLPALARWLRAKSSYAARLGMDMTYLTQAPRSTHLEQTYSLPVEMTLKVRSGLADKAYIRVLEFIRSLIDENLHLEIAGNELKSDGRGVKQIRLNINVWVRDANSIAGENAMTPSENKSVNSDVPFVQ